VIALSDVNERALRHEPFGVGETGNTVLDRLCEGWMKRARVLSAQSGQTEHVYGELHYAAKSWSRKRRIIVKAEVVRLPDREPRDNARFVITNLPIEPQQLYEDIYCQRAHIELRIKELHHGLEIDRTSCTRFLDRAEIVIGSGQGRARAPVEGLPLGALLAVRKVSPRPWPVSTRLDSWGPWCALASSCGGTQGGHHQSQRHTSVTGCSMMD